MVCIYCSNKTKVVNSRYSKQSLQTWRRRECLNCHSIFTTREHPDLEISIRVKHPSGSLEPFSRDKLFISVYRSLSHRKTALQDATALTDTIISLLLKQKSSVFTQKIIIDQINRVLLNFDEVARTYYVAHHHN